MSDDPKNRAALEAIQRRLDPRFAEEQVAALVAANITDDIERMKAAKGPMKITSSKRLPLGEK